MPYASLAVTTGSVVNANPAVAPAGWVVNEICEAVADPTVNDVEVPVIVPCVALSVVVWAL